MSSFLDKESKLVGLVRSAEIINELIDFVYGHLEKTQIESIKLDLKESTKEGSVAGVVERFCAELIPKINKSKEYDDKLKQSFLLIFYMMSHIASDKLDSIVKKFVTDLTQNDNTKELKISLLKSCHCILGKTKPLKLLVALETFKFAAKYNLENEVNIGLTSALLVKLTAKWKLDNSEKLALYLACFDCFSSDEEVLSCGMLILDLHWDFKSIPVSIQKVAAKCGVLAVKSCTSSDSSRIFFNPAFQSLKITESNAIYILMKDFVDSNAVTNFTEVDAEKLGLDFHAITGNLKLLALRNVCATEKIVSYDELARFIQVENNEIEKWVIRAISEKLIDAKLDQLQRQIIVTTAMSANSMEEKTLEPEAELAAWTKSLRSALLTLKTNE